MGKDIFTSVTTDERRRARREKVPRHAAILVDEKHEYSCVVRDLSETGAKVESSPQTIGLIPDQFDLLIDRDKPRRSKVVWRRTKQVGVTFL